MKKYFLSKKNILLKHSGVRSYFEAFIKINTTVQSDFNFDARFLNYNIFIFEIMCMHVLFSSLIVSHMHAYTHCRGSRTAGLLYGRP